MNMVEGRGNKKTVLTNGFFCAQDKSRTCTGVLPLPPQSSVSTNSTTWARFASAKVQLFFESDTPYRKNCIFAAPFSPGGGIGRHATLRG